MVYNYWLKYNCKGTILLMNFQDLTELSIVFLDLKLVEKAYLIYVGNFTKESTHTPFSREKKTQTKPNTALPSGCKLRLITNP